MGGLDFDVGDHPRENIVLNFDLLQCVACSHDSDGLTGLPNGRLYDFNSHGAQRQHRVSDEGFIVRRAETGAQQVTGRAPPQATSHSATTYNGPFEYNTGLVEPSWKLKGPVCNQNRSYLWVDVTIYLPPDTPRFYIRQWDERNINSDLQI